MLTHPLLRTSIGALAGLLLAACPGEDGPGSATESTEDTSSPTTSVDSATTGLTETGAPASCGDGVLDPGEGCDDGEANGEAADCTPACEPASCGDGFVHSGEGCDDGNDNDNDGCTNQCALASCGDGVKDLGEACDDGDGDNSDGCLVGCKLAFCGDGYVHDGFEVCDDANEDNSDGCLVDCTPNVCGDGYVRDGVEACDDMNQDNSDACLADCTPNKCGDGYVHEGVENCDDGNAVDDDACANDCTGPATCEDGKKNGKESDVDCGGPNCVGCDDDETCNTGSDCASTFCDEGLCVTPRHCRDIRDLGLAAEDGVYPIDPDGPGVGLTAFGVFCEMTFNGGGWTAVFNMRELPVGEASADKFLAAISANQPAQPVLPNSNSAAIYTTGLPLAEFNEALFGWAPSLQGDVNRYGKLTAPTGLAGLCYLDGFCGPGVEVGSFDIVPTGNTRALFTGKATDFPHVGLGFDDQIIVWGYDRNASHFNNWGNWFDEGPCCKAGNSADINEPGWRYVIYVR